MDNSKITQVLQISCVSAPLIPFASCPTHPETWGSGRAGQSLPCPKPAEMCLIISWANNTYRQLPCLLATPSTTIPSRGGRKAPLHFLYDTLSLFSSLRKWRKRSLPSLTALFSPPWQGCLGFVLPAQRFSGSG